MEGKILDKNTRRVISLFTIIFIGVSLLMAGCTDKPTADTQAQQVSTETAVSVQKSQRGNISGMIEYTGRLKPLHDVYVIPKLAGKVVSIPVSVGTSVKKGDLLLEFDTSDLQPQINQAQAAYNVAKINIDDAKKKKSDLQNLKKKLTDQQNSLLSQQKQLNNTITQLTNQMADLKKQLAVAPTEQAKAQIQSAIDALQVQLSKAQDGLTSIGEALKTVQSQLSTLASSEMQLPSDDLLNAQLKQAEAALNAAKYQLGNAKVYAPISGIVASINTDVGSMVSQSTPPMDIIDTSKMLLDIQVTENNISKIKSGQEVTLKIDVLPDKEFSGVIKSVSPTPDPRSQNYPVRIEIANDDAVLKAGMFARAEIAIEKKENVILVPTMAVLDENGVKYVYVVENGKAKKIEVETGLDDGEMVEITKGIDEGQDIIVEGQQYLSDGSDVTVVK